MPFHDKRRRLWQIGLLSGGLVIILIIAAASVYLLSVARTESSWVVHTVEAENQIAKALLDLRRAESSSRAFLLTQNPAFKAAHDESSASVLPALAELERLVGDNPRQIEATKALRDASSERLAELQRSIDLVAAGQISEATEMIRNAGLPASMTKVRDVSNAMLKEEARLLAERTAASERARTLSAWVTIGGSLFLVLFAAASMLLVRQSSRERDAAEAQLRDTNLNLESLVDARTIDLREANEEIQRFAYIVSHDLRSPLVNIMGFTSELEELRADIFGRIARLATPAAPTAAAGDEPELTGEDRRLSDEFSEALGFIKSSIGKMDRLIGAILNLTREGRRKFTPEHIRLGEMMRGITGTVAHQAQEAEATITVEELPELISDRLSLEQIFGNLIDNALKYLKPGVPGRIVIRGRKKLGFAIIEIVDNGRGIDPKDHQRIFDLFRRAGAQDRPGQGIGLAHVRALVRRMGGSLNVESELDRGSTFTVTLPLILNIKEGSNP
jgi:signal transduction histidine kinase